MEMGVAKEEVMLLRKDKKSKKKNKSDNGLLSAEENEIQDRPVESKDIGVGLAEDENILLKKEKKSKKKDRNDNVLLNAEAKEMIREDSGVEPKEDDERKKKRGQREKKNKESCLQDINVNGEGVVAEKDHAGTHEKKRKFDCEKHAKDQESAVERILAKEEKKQKVNRKKGEQDMGSHHESLGLSKDEKELVDVIELKVTQDKKKRNKEKKHKSEEGMTASLGENKKYEETGKNVEIQVEKNKEGDISVDVEAEQGYSISKGKKEAKKRKRKDKMSGEVESLLVNNFDENSSIDNKNRNIGLDEERIQNSHVDTEVEEGYSISGEKKEAKKKKDKMGGNVDSLLVNNIDENSAKDNKILNTELEEERNKKSHVDSKDVEEFNVNKAKKEAKKKKRKEKGNMGGDVESILVSFDKHSTKDNKIQTIENDEERNKKIHAEGGSNIGLGHSKKMKKESKSNNNITDPSRKILETSVVVENIEVGGGGGSFNEGCSGSAVKKKRCREKGALPLEMEKFEKSGRKKAKFVKDVEETDLSEGEIRTRNKVGSADCSENAKSKKTSKRVQFSGKVDVFPLPDVSDVEKHNQEDGLVRGKRFSKEEDTIIKTAVLKYIKEHDLGEDGIKLVMRCISNPETRNCWSEICSAMPWRPKRGIYNRAHILFERDETRSWTPEDCELIKKFHEKHGPKWRMLADEMQKSRIHVKDTWRRICLPKRNKGPWSQEEYQKLFDLVNLDLRMKIFEEKKSKHGMLRDNIAWEAISQKISTRANMDCCMKWYKQLESPLVREGEWVSSDDLRMLNELVVRDYSSVEEVDWDDLLEHRPGDVCRKRWNQMVSHLGEHGNKLFADQVEVLSKRYCPDVLEAREVYENKTPVT